jgi:hypothetical protein
LVVCVDREAAAATVAAGRTCAGTRRWGATVKVESIPEVMNGVGSSASGKCMRAYLLKCTGMDLFQCDGLAYQFLELRAVICLRLLDGFHGHEAEPARLASVSHT